LLWRAFNLAIENKELIRDLMSKSFMLPEAAPRAGFLEDEQIEAVIAKFIAKRSLSAGQEGGATHLARVRPRCSENRVFDVKRTQAQS
jgi:hypothetical protein